MNLLSHPRHLHRSQLRFLEHQDPEDSVVPKDIPESSSVDSDKIELASCFQPMCVYKLPHGQSLKAFQAIFLFQLALSDCDMKIK